jgi:hypothetical protein
MYTGRMIELDKVVGKVQKGADGRYFLIAAESARSVKRRSQGPQMMSPGEYQRRMQGSALNTKYVPGVILYLDPKAATEFSGLGDKVLTVRGRCKGITKDEQTQPDYFVTVEGVRLVDAQDR